MRKLCLYESTKSSGCSHWGSTFGYTLAKSRICAPGREQFDKQVYVAAGKTLRLNPNLHVQAQPQVQR